jgi:hypothetical protein
VGRNIFFHVIAELKLDEVQYVMSAVKGFFSDQE